MIFQITLITYHYILLINCASCLSLEDSQIFTVISNNSEETLESIAPATSAESFELSSSPPPSKVVSTKSEQSLKDESIDDCKFTFGHSTQPGYKFECENPNSLVKMCTYLMKVGITKKPMDKSYSEAAAILQAKAKLDISFATILQSVGDEIWTGEQEKVLSLKVPPRTKFILHQVVGTCGQAYEVRTSNTNMLALPATSSAAPVHTVERSTGVNSQSASQESAEWQGSLEFEFDSSNSNENHPITSTATRVKNSLENDEKRGFDCENWDSGCDRSKNEPLSIQPVYNKRNSSFIRRVYPRSGNMQLLESTDGGTLHNSHLHHLLLAFLFILYFVQCDFLFVS